jgi:trk system potassium uptake protein TrkH
MGGLGFPVVLELLRYGKCLLRKKHTHLNLHTKIVLVATAGLLIIGTGLIYVSEPQCHSGEHPLLPAYFQSVTARTAGFNTIQFSKASDATLLVSCALMFIGGSSGSTAGGIKTTTLMVVLALAWSYISGKAHPEFSNRTISHKNTVKALSLLVFFALLILFASLGLLLLHADQDIPRKFAGAVFETISAIGTVGLSTGFTKYLTGSGKLIIVVVMFLGRLGPLAMVKMFVKQESMRRIYKFPEENLMIG